VEDGVTVAHGDGFLFSKLSDSEGGTLVVLRLWAPSYSGGTAWVSFSDGRFGAGRFEAAWLRRQFVKEAPTRFDSHGGATGGSLYRGKRSA
jgi:hypothetical protein